MDLDTVFCLLALIANCFGSTPAGKEVTLLLIGALLVQVERAARVHLSGLYGLVEALTRSISTVDQRTQQQNPMPASSSTAMIPSVVASQASTPMDNSVQPFFLFAEKLITTMLPPMVDMMQKQFDKAALPAPESSETPVHPASLPPVRPHPPPSPPTIVQVENTN